MGSCCLIGQDDTLVNHDHHTPGPTCGTGYGYARNSGNSDPPNQGAACHLELHWEDSLPCMGPVGMHPTDVADTDEVASVNNMSQEP